MHGDVVFGEIRYMSSERTSGVAWTSALPFANDYERVLARFGARGITMFAFALA